MTVVLVHVKHRKIIEGRKRKLSPLRHQTCVVPSRNHEPSSELLRFVRGVCPNFRHTCQFFITSSWWHDITSSMVSCFSDHFLTFWNLNDMALHACVHAVTTICLKIPSNLLHMELTCTQVHKYDFQAVMVSRCM